MVIMHLEPEKADFQLRQAAVAVEAVEAMSRYLYVVANT